jgi:hypothetical protein
MDLVRQMSGRIFRQKIRLDGPILNPLSSVAANVRRSERQPKFRLRGKGVYVMDPVVMIALEVGTTKEQLLAKYADGKLSVELEKPAKIGKLSDILGQYNIDVSKWPKFLQELLALEAMLWAIDYHAAKIGTTTKTTLSATDFTAASGMTFPDELEGAELVLDSSDADQKTYLVKKNGSALEYTATLADSTYTLEHNVYKFIIEGSYEKAFTLIRGVVALKSIVFGITNDPGATAAKFEEECRKLLAPPKNANTLPSDTTRTS